MLTVVTYTEQSLVYYQLILGGISFLYNYNRVFSFLNIFLCNLLFSHRLWHHMHGADIKDLNIYMKNAISKKTEILSHLSGAWSVEGTAQTRALEPTEDWWNEHQTEITVTDPAFVSAFFN